MQDNCDMTTLIPRMWRITEQSITGYRRAIALAEAIDSDQLAVLYNRLATALANDSTDLDEAVKLSGKSLAAGKTERKGEYMYTLANIYGKKVIVGWLRQIVIRPLNSLQRIWTSTYLAQ